MQPIVTLTTDFGQADGYVGTVKGVVLGINPGAQLVDLSHDIGAQNIAEGAFVIYRAYRFFPQGTVHIGVVDPGVGSKRRPLLLETKHGLFVGPDNGLFSLVLKAELAEALGLAYPGSVLPPAWLPGLDIAALDEADLAKPGVPRAYELDRPEYWLGQISTTFHGRDIFGPSAAHASAAVAPASLGTPVPLADLTQLPGNNPTVADGVASGQIIHVDRFGNLITNIHEALLAQVGDAADLVFAFGDQQVEGLHQTFANVAVGDTVAYVGSEHLLEVGIRNGNAATGLGGRVGLSVTCRKKP